MTQAVVIATANAGKLREFQRLLGPGFDLHSAGELSGDWDVDETADSYLGNARLKAQAASVLTALPVIADDSGIEALGLGEWPGVRSARWRPGSDAERNAGLAERILRESPDDRRLRYRCVVVMVEQGNERAIGEGSCDGVLTAGCGERGFGYDPIFLSDDLGCTFGEAADSDKDRVSHRARALRALLQQISW